MKTRSGFVSNSSSSSFVVISDDTEHMLPWRQYENERFIAIGEKGEYDFGWQHERYSDFPSKLNFVYIQAMALQEYTGDDKWLKLIHAVLRHWKITRVEVRLSLETQSKYFGIIDHSSAYEEDKNCEMFESAKTLEQFLFNPLSYIQCQNDGG